VKATSVSVRLRIFLFAFKIPNTRSYLFTCWLVSLYVNLTCGSPLDLFGSPSAEIDIHQNSWNSVSVPPISMLVIAFKPFLYSLVDIKMILIYRQQTRTSMRAIWL